MAQGALLLPRSVKPSGFARLNLAHPMARGIAAFLLPSGNGTFYDALTQRQGLRNANITLISTSEGRALHCNGSSGIVNVLGSIRNPLAVQNTAVSVIARLRLTAKSGNQGIAAQYGGTAGNNARGAFVGFNSSGNPFGGASTSGGVVGVTGTGDQSNIWVTLAACHTATTAQGQLWQNGVSKGTAINGVDNNVTTAATLIIGKQSDAYASSYTGDIAWVIAFNRIIRDDDAAFFFRTPFAVLQQERNYSFFSLPAAGGTVYNVTLSEAGSASDTISSVVIFPSTITESGSAADTVSNVAVLPSSISESGAGTDTVSNVVIFPSSISEIGSGADTVSNVAILSSAISENATAIDTISNIATLPSTIGESGSAVDTISSAAILPSTVAETGLATDVISASLVYNVAISEISAAADTISTLVVFVGNLAETGSSQDTVSNNAVLASTLLEVGAAIEVISNNAVLLSSISESGSATDVIGLALALNVSILEAGNASDIISAIATFLDSTRRFVLLLGLALQTLQAPVHRPTLVLGPRSYCSLAVESHGMPFFGTFPPVAQAQKQTISMDFGQFLPFGVGLTGTPTLALSVAFGADSSPSSRVTSGPIVGTVSTTLGGSGITNTAILFQVFGCLPGVDYIAEVTCSRTDGDVVEGSARLPCHAPGIQ